MKNKDYNLIVNRSIEQAVQNVCKKFNKNFVAMLPEGVDLSFADKYSFDKVVVGVDSTLIHTFYLQLISSLRTK